MSENKKEFTEEQQAVTIPFFLHENEMTRLERLNKRWFIAFLVAIVMLFVTNAGWIVYESQFETYSVEQDVDTGTGSAYVAGVGDVNYGESASENSSAGEENQLQEPNEAMPNL